MSFIVRGLSSLLGTVLPCFYSYKAMKKPTNPKLTHWLQYWTVYGSFSALDWIANTFFISCFIPFYEIFVLMFIVYLSIPQFGGPAFVYKKILAPFLRRKEQQVDTFLGKCFSAIWTNAPSLLSNAFNGLVKMIGDSADPEVLIRRQVVTAVTSESRMIQNVVSYFAPNPNPTMRGSAQVEVQDESDDECDYIPISRRQRRVLQYDTDETDETTSVSSTVMVKAEPVDDYEAGDDADIQIIESTRRRSATSSSSTVVQIPEAAAPQPRRRGRPRGATKTKRVVKVEEDSES